MKVEQFDYLSPEACIFRRRDGTRPWDVHPCEVDSFGEGDTDWKELIRARELRAAIEAATEGVSEGAFNPELERVRELRAKIEAELGPSDGQDPSERESKVRHAMKVAMAANPAQFHFID